MLSQQFMFFWPNKAQRTYEEMFQAISDACIMRGYYKYIQLGKCFVGKLSLDGNTLGIKSYLVNAQIIPSWIWLLVFCNIIHMVSISFGNCRFSKCILVLILGLLSWILV